MVLQILKSKKMELTLFPRYKRLIEVILLQKDIFLCGGSSKKCLNQLKFFCWVQNLTYYLLKIETYSLSSKWMGTDSKLNKSKALFT